MRRLCVFCGSCVGRRAVYADAARRFGELLGERGIGLVYGGGHIGLMGVVAEAVLARRGEAIGVIPRAMVEKELAYEGLSQLHVVDTMHQRKALMAELSDGFVALPGGFGTGDELFEILTWAQLGLHARPIGLLNTAGYFDSLLAWLDHALAEDFLRREHRQLLLAADQPEPLLDQLLAYQPPTAALKWIGTRDI